MRHVMLQRRELLMPFPSMPLRMTNQKLCLIRKVEPFPISTSCCIQPFKNYPVRFLQTQQFETKCSQFNLHCLINCPAQTLNNSPSDLIHSLKFLIIMLQIKWCQYFVCCSPFFSSRVSRWELLNLFIFLEDVLSGDHTPTPAASSFESKRHNHY